MRPYRAPAARGLSLELVEHLIGRIAEWTADKLTLAEIAECNPEFDQDGRTARVAARFCHQLMRNLTLGNTLSGKGETDE